MGRIRFNIINRETGTRVRYRQIDAEPGDNVPKEDCVKEYNTADGSHMLLEPEELEAAPRRGGKKLTQAVPPAAREVGAAKGKRLKRAS